MTKRLQRTKETICARSPVCHCQTGRGHARRGASKNYLTFRFRGGGLALGELRLSNLDRCSAHAGNPVADYYRVTNALRKPLFMPVWLRCAGTACRHLRCHCTGPGPATCNGGKNRKERQSAQRSARSLASPARHQAARLPQGDC